MRDPQSKLWCIPLPIEHYNEAATPSLALANGIIKRDTPISDLCAFLHASLFSPTTSTLESAIKKGFFHSFPGLNLKTTRKYLPRSVATAKGHTTQEKTNIMSSKAPTSK